MNKFSGQISSKIFSKKAKTTFISVFAFVFFSLISFASSTTPAKNSSLPKTLTHNELLNKLYLAKGKGTFTQKKYFKFLSEPIVSQGLFVLQQKSALWETQSPVFSQLLLSPNVIYTRLDSSKAYRPLVENGEFSRLLSTLLSGEFNQHEWKNISVTRENCIQLTPTNASLEKVFSSVEICLIDKFNREINLLDANNNKTKINMLITDFDLKEADVAKLLPTNTPNSTP